MCEDMGETPKEDFVPTFDPELFPTQTAASFDFSKSPAAWYTAKHGKDVPFDLDATWRSSYEQYVAIKEHINEQGD